MGKNKIGIIIGREFSIRVKKRSFILTTILTPLLFAGLMLVPGLIAYYTASSQESKKVSVYDATGVVEGKLNSIFPLRIFRGLRMRLSRAEMRISFCLP